MGRKLVFRMPLRRVPLVLVAGSLALIAWLTLRPAASPGLTAWCLQCGEFWLRDWILNIGLFVPLGAALALAGVRTSRVALLATALSLGIEVLQWTVIPGRSPSTGDVLMNGLGGLTGAAVVSSWSMLVRPSPSAALRIGVASMVAWLSFTTFAAWCMVPAPPHGTLWGQLTPDLGNFEQYRGELLHARLQGLPFPSGEMANPEPIRAALAANNLSVDVVVRPGAAPGNLAPIVSIFSGGRVEAMLLGQRGRDLVFSTRRRASNIGLVSPRVAVSDALEPSDSTRFLAIGDGASGYALGVMAFRGGALARRVVRQVSVGPEMWWRLLLHAETLPSMVRWLFDVALLPILLLPGALSLRRSAGRSRGVFAGIVALCVWAVGTIFIPDALNVNAAPITAWVTGAALVIVACWRVRAPE